ARTVTSIDKLARVANVDRASGGADAQPIAEAILRGPGQLRAMGRGGTAADYEAHAMRFRVAQAPAVAGAVWGVDLHVAPPGLGQPGASRSRRICGLISSPEGP